MNVNGISNLNGYKQVYNGKSQNNTSNPPSFKASGYGDDGYSSSVASEYIKKQQLQKQQMELEKQKKDKWKQFGFDVLKGVTIGAALIGGTYLAANLLISNKALAKITHNYGLKNADGTFEFKKFEKEAEVSYESCKNKLKKDLAISQSQQEAVINNICTANKTIREGKYNGANVNPSKNRGIIMYGRGGIGKSYAMETIAKACGASYLSIKGADFMSKYQGESEAILKSILLQAKTQAEKTPDEPLIIFLDEGESIMGSGRTENGNNTNANLRSLLLGAMETQGEDALPSNVKFIVTTNYVDDIDEPYRRDGRLGIPMEILCPDADGQANIMRMQFEKQFEKEYENYKSVIDEYIKNRTEFLKSCESKDIGVKEYSLKLEQAKKELQQTQEEKINLQKALNEKMLNGTLSSDEKDKQLEAVDKKVKDANEKVEAAKYLLQQTQLEVSQGRYFNFTPAEIKGVVANAMELLSVDSKYKGGVTVDNLIKIELDKIQQLKIEAQKREEERAKKQKGAFKLF